ncbi:MAG: universal stress protein [Actinomycetota bacterium]
MATESRDRSDDGPVVVRYDDSPAGSDALLCAIATAVESGASLRIIHSYRVPAGPESPSSYLQRSHQAYLETNELADRAEQAIVNEHPGIEVERVIAHGPPNAVLGKHAADASVLVVPQRTRRGLIARYRARSESRLVDLVSCPIVEAPPSDSQDDLTRS